MIYQLFGIFADILIVVHILWAIGIIGGTFLSLIGELHKTGLFTGAYVSFALVTIISNVMFDGCLFTIWEKQIRFHLHPPLTEIYTTGFAAHYLNRFLNIQVSDTDVNAAFLTLIIISFIALISWTAYENYKLNNNS